MESSTANQITKLGGHVAGVLSPEPNELERARVQDRCQGLGEIRKDVVPGSRDAALRQVVLDRVHALHSISGAVQDQGWQLPPSPRVVHSRPTVCQNNKRGGGSRGSTASVPPLYGAF